jgi:hypothetical protein
MPLSHLPPLLIALKKCKENYSGEKLFFQFIFFKISQRHRGKNAVHLHTSEIINVYLRNKEVKSLHFARSLNRSFKEEYCCVSMGGFWEAARI